MPWHVESRTPVIFLLEKMVVVSLRTGRGVVVGMTTFLVTTPFLIILNTTTRRHVSVSGFTEHVGFNIMWMKIAWNWILDTPCSKTCHLAMRRFSSGYFVVFSVSVSLYLPPPCVALSCHAPPPPHSPHSVHLPLFSHCFLCPLPPWNYISLIYDAVWLSYAICLLHYCIAYMQLPPRKVKSLLQIWKHRVLPHTFLWIRPIIAAANLSA